MPQVMLFPGRLHKGLGAWQDAVSKLANALDHARVLIHLCSDGPNKTCLLKQQKFLKELLEDAKAEIQRVPVELESL